MPILYSFKRCPYAMRARMALCLSKIIVELREVSLRNKPQSLLEISPKATVPVLLLDDGSIIDESIEIIDWCIDNKKDMFKDTLNKDQELFAEDVIKLFDEKFKFHLDRYKYATRYENVDAASHRDACLNILRILDKDSNVISLIGLGDPFYIHLQHIGYEDSNVFGGYIQRDFDIPVSLDSKATQISLMEQNKFGLKEIRRIELN